MNPKRIAAIMIALRKSGAIKRLGGLHQVIQKLRTEGYRASDYQTLFHTTLKSNIPSIQRRGLQPFTRRRKTGISALMGAPKDIKGVYGGSHDIASAYAFNIDKSIRNIDRPNVEKSLKLARAQYEQELSETDSWLPKDQLRSQIKKIDLLDINLRRLKKNKDKAVVLKYLASRGTTKSLKARQGDIGKIIPFDEFLTTTKIPSYMIRKSKRIPIHKVRRIQNKVLESQGNPKSSLFNP